MKNKLLVVILVLAAFLRLYNLPQTLMFQGDQGRDALLVSKIFTQHDPVFIGPVTSVGNMYLGPLYYYMMLPFLFATYPSPVGPAYMVALLSIMTCFLIYKLGQELVGQRAALIATFIFSFAWVVIYHARFSWNPNPAPFFSLLILYFTFKAQQGLHKYWLGVAVCVSVLLQLHYLAGLSLAGVGLVWLYQASTYLRQKKKKWLQLKNLFLMTALSVVIVLVSFTPLVLFDLKHDGLNAKALTNLVLSENNFKTAQTTFFQEAAIVVRESHGRSMHVLFDLWLGQHRQLNTALVIMAVILTLNLVRQKKNPHRRGLLVISSFLVTSIIGISFYKHTIFDHYIAYLFPITSLFLGALMSQYWSYKVAKVVSIVFLLFFSWYNWGQMNLQPLGWTIFDYQRVAEQIVGEIDPNKKYNLVLLSESKDIYGLSYRYFLSATDHPPVAVENHDQAQQLVVINENQPESDIVSLPIYEIVTFGQKQIEKRYTVSDGPEIIILNR